MSCFEILKDRQFLFMLLFIMEWLIILSFTVLDLFFFCLFFESLIIPMFFVIINWGGRDRRIVALTYLIMYTLLGSLFLFWGLFIVYHDCKSTSYFVIFDPEILANMSSSRQRTAWFLFFISFAMKIPILPFHIWLPEAHVEAPTVGSVILAGLLLKLGGYGMLRLLFAFKEARYYFEPYILVMCLVSVFYASFMAMCQNDMKRIIAYSSVAHMNFALIGFFSENYYGMIGGMSLMISHGIVSAGLFSAVGVLYDRHHDRGLFNFGALAQLMPGLTTIMLLFMISNFSFPTTSNFVGELIIFIGLAQIINKYILMLALISTFLGLVYSMFFYNRWAYGNWKENLHKLWEDVTFREAFLLSLFVFFNFLFGIVPMAMISTFLLSIFEALKVFLFPYHYGYTHETFNIMGLTTEEAITLEAFAHQWWVVWQAERAKWIEAQKKKKLVNEVSNFGGGSILPDNEEAEDVYQKELLAKAKIERSNFLKDLFNEDSPEKVLNTFPYIKFDKNGGSSIPESYRQDPDLQWAVNMVEDMFYQHRFDEACTVSKQPEFLKLINSVEGTYTPEEMKIQLSRLYHKRNAMEISETTLAVVEELRKLPWSMKETIEILEWMYWVKICLQPALDSKYIMFFSIERLKATLGSQEALPDDFIAKISTREMLQQFYVDWEVMSRLFGDLHNPRWEPSLAVSNSLKSSKEQIFTDWQEQFASMFSEDFAIKFAGGAEFKNTLQDCYIELLKNHEHIGNNFSDREWVDIVCHMIAEDPRNSGWIAPELRKIEEMNRPFLDRYTSEDFKSVDFKNYMDIFFLFYPRYSFYLPESRALLIEMVDRAFMFYYVMPKIVAAPDKKDWTDLAWVTEDILGIAAEQYPILSPLTREALKTFWLDDQLLNGPIFKEKAWASKPLEEVEQEYIFAHKDGVIQMTDEEWIDNLLKQSLQAAWEVVMVNPSCAEVVSYELSVDIAMRQIKATTPPELLLRQIETSYFYHTIFPIFKPYNLESDAKVRIFNNFELIAKTQPPLPKTPQMRALIQDFFIEDLALSPMLDKEFWAQYDYKLAPLPQDAWERLHEFVKKDFEETVYRKVEIDNKLGRKVQTLDEIAQELETLQTENPLNYNFSTTQMWVDHLLLWRVERELALLEKQKFLNHLEGPELAVVSNNILRDLKKMYKNDIEKIGQDAELEYYHTYIFDNLFINNNFWTQDKDL
jgi:NADH-quinone oxidoreductase subunit M